MINREKRSKALSEVKPVEGYPMWGKFFLNLSVFLTKCVDKISRPNVVNKFGVFFDKKKMKYTILSLSSPPEIKLLTVMMAFNPLMHNVPKWTDTL